MRNLLCIAPAAALALAGCSDTCTSKAAELQPASGGCGSTTLAAGALVTISVKPACQTCSETSPRCNGEIVGSQIELNPVFKECDSDKNCGDPSCAFGQNNTFGCAAPMPAVSGSYPLLYPTAGGGNGQITVTVAAGGVTSCTL